MKSRIFLLALALSTSMGTFFVVAQNGNPPRNGPDQAPRERGPAGADHGRGGPESPGEPGGPGGFRLLPRDGQQQLDLTFEQAEQVSDLEAKIRLKLRKILTVEQFRHLNQIRSRQRPEGPNGPANETSESRGQQFPDGERRSPGGPGGPGGPANELGRRRGMDEVDVERRGTGERGGPDNGRLSPGGPDAERGGQSGPVGQRPQNPLVLALDRNHDGTIDADELAKAIDSLKKLDRNSDGRLTPDEYRPRRTDGPGGPRGQDRPRGPESQRRDGEGQPPRSSVEKNP